VKSTTFTRELRLLTPSHFKHVFSNPKRAGSPYLTLLARPSEQSHPRLGLAVPKKHVNKAHDRNRIKRVIRDSFRLKQHELPNVDLVVIAKGGINKLSKDEMRTVLEKLWIKISHQYKKQA